MVGTGASEVRSQSDSGKERPSKSSLSCSATFCRQDLGLGYSCTPYHFGNRLWGLGCKHKETKQADRNVESKPKVPVVAKRDLRMPNLRESIALQINKVELEVPPKPICRFCLETSELALIEMFNPKSKFDVPTPDDIWQLLGIEVKPRDKLPKGICVTCQSKINYMKRIRKQFQENDRTLQEQLKALSPTVEPVQSTESEEQKPVFQEVSESEPTEATCTEKVVKVADYALEDEAYFIKLEQDEQERRSGKEEQLLTSDQITIEGEELEIESTTIIKTEANPLAEVEAPHFGLLYTGNFTEADSARIKEEPRYDDFNDDHDEMTDESGNAIEAVIMKPEKRRCYGRFRFP
ncbi:uncharacterized protein LOC131440063 [Malaya genurostris]|uniref:uncharacterized protein LOC131434541 n=1 Tax=Malaya genurostris TaxID=325434 RepID=UPI0026F3E3B5|nr:uncharacterized protein LOC131434541 [Malaya genurostris]XP_058467138.1 uncharacterized protein LOC131440063 [Malaya genurostris]